MKQTNILCFQLQRNLQNDLRKSSEQLEALKTELHDFYQAQLERVVRDKLKEFQTQLDAAESTLQRELESRERSVAQLAARQLQHVTEKYELFFTLILSNFVISVHFIPFIPIFLPLLKLQLYLLAIC